MLYVMCANSITHTDPWLDVIEPVQQSALLRGLIARTFTKQVQKPSYSAFLYWYHFANQ